MSPFETEHTSLNRSASASSKPPPGYHASGSLDEPQRPSLIPESAGEPVAGLPTKPDRPDLSRANPEEVIALKRVVFLVGAPRSGTTWLQLLLSRSPRVVTANETYLFTGYTRSLFAAWAHHQRNVRAVGLHNLMSEAEYFDLIRNLTCKVMLRILDKNPGADIVLEKTPDHVLHWRDILKIFPEAYFLHIVRDPRSVVSSLCAASRVAWGDKWTSGEVLMNCETWIKYIKESKKLKAATDNFMQVTYQDLWHNGEETLTSIFSWLGVQVSLTECSTILRECQIANLRGGRLEGAPWDMATEPQEFYRKGGTENWRSELTSRETFLIEHLARDLMTEFGFIADSRPRIIFPLIIASRLRFALAWRLVARQAKREAASSSKEGTDGRSD
jgi:Sulfotransferase family